MATIEATATKTDMNESPLTPGAMSETTTPLSEGNVTENLPAAKRLKMMEDNAVEKSAKENLSGKRVVIVCTSENQMPHRDGTPGHQTGLWIEEAAAPYYVFKQAGCTVTFASPRGGAVPIDPASMQGDFFTEAAKKFMHDAEAFGKLCLSQKVSAVSAADVDLLFLAGGHGTVADFVENKELQKLIEDVSLHEGTTKVLAAVFHGPTALVRAKRADGKPLLEGRRATGFSNAEEGPEGVGLVEKVPVVLEDAMKETGKALYEAAAPWSSHVVSDGGLLTGQNPQSSEQLAQKSVEKLEELVVQKNKITGTN